MFGYISKSKFFVVVGRDFDVPSYYIFRVQLICPSWDIEKTRFLNDFARVIL